MALNSFCIGVPAPFGTPTRYVERLHSDSGNFNERSSTMKNTATVILVAMLLVCLAVPASALNSYTQNFEAMSDGDPAALSNDGWLVFGNVFGLDWAYWYGYGPFPAPNDGGGFCTVGVGDYSQFLNVFSDYNNGDHPNANIESNVFQEQVIDASDVGQTWLFTFDAKRGNLEGSTTANAFIKTLDPGAGYAMTNYLTENMTIISSSSWGTYMISIYIDAGLAGQILQFGFNNICTNYAGSGVFYDNVVFQDESTIPVEETTWGSIKNMYK